MLDRVAVGTLASKHHVALRDAAGTLRYEECLTRRGFDGAYSILYHASRPQALEHVSTETALVLQARAPRELRRRHFRTRGAAAARAWSEASTPLIYSSDVALNVARVEHDEPAYFANADADLLLFVAAGRGMVRSPFGDLDFEPHDYVCIPKGVAHRLLVHEPLELLRIECDDLRIPPSYRNELGQLRMDAPYSHRDFRRPRFEGPRDEGIRELIVQRDRQRHRFAARQSLLDVVGWDGTVYPWAFPILAFQPRVGSVHLPPTLHGTFAARGALICSFVPRLLDFGPDAIPCPYPHASVDVDEILYYVSGDFGSRSGVEAGSVTLHPRGVPHGPQPGKYEQSIGQQRTSELAVMLDCYAPLDVTTHAEPLEDAAYDASFG